MEVIRTLHGRLKDKHRSALLGLSRQVNDVWNFCNELSHRSITEKRVWNTGYDLQKSTTGYTLCDGVNLLASTVQLVCVEYALRRNQFNKNKLRWRNSNPKSPAYSLGWIPFKRGTVKYKNGQLHMGSFHFNLWDSYGLGDYELLSGTFSEDARGRWYFNIQVKVNVPESTGAAILGIDPGLKTAATCSDGDKLEPRWFCAYEEKLAKAQRKNKKKRVRAIHAKVKNIRADDMHKFTTKKVYESSEIYVGDVSSKKFAKTHMAKMTYDSSWGMLKRMLEYKCTGAGVRFKVVNEAYTSMTCSACDTIPASSPKGKAGLKIRQWKCCSCGAVHDRDINAACNIAKRGHALSGI